MMTEKVGISLVTEAAKAVGMLIMARPIEEMKMMWGLKDDLEKLRSKFSDLQLFLTDVESAQHVDKRAQVNNWVLKVKDAAYVVDDIIDDYDYEIIRRKREKKRKFQAFFTRNNAIVFRVRMSHKVRDALAMFDELEKKAQKMGLKQVEITKDEIIAGTFSNNYQGSYRLSEAREHASANATEFVGREEEKNKLIEILCRPCNQEDHISTVAILGMGGIGKTTFARCLYDSKDIEAHFEKKFWISMSDNLGLRGILNEMIENVASINGNWSNTGAIITKLQEKLKNKKYLLVLDDVWCIDQDFWSSLKNLLQKIGDLPGCFILITTRLIEVTMRSQSVTHLLRELSEEEGWTLLKQRVSLIGTSPNFSILEESGKKIVAKCNGFPLAIKSIGGMLQSKQLPHEWESIEKNEIWDLPQTYANQILSLRLTFDHLPSPAMKQCFAYCAAFNRGYMMEKDELVDIWLAQGFLHGSEITNLSMEEIGEKYLMVLLNYSLLDEVRGEERRYKMHDLVYDLAVDVSGKDLIFSQPKHHHKIDICRHLVIDKKNVEALSNLPVKKTLRKLRTISNGLPHNVLAHAKYLRTLLVDKCDIKELPSSIGLLKHLRFLSLSYNPIKTLPNSIRKLYLLQTLRLRHCSNMRILPAILYRLTNLIHIRTTTLMLASRGLLELTNLHTLPRLALGDDEDGWSIDELGSLQNLMGEIHISGLEHVKAQDNARKADLAGKAKVSNITLVWTEEREEISGGSYDEDVLDVLQPPVNIISLELQNFFGLIFPSWMVRMEVVSEGGSPSLLENLTSLKLLNCSRCRMLPTLGHLPSLKYLVLSGIKVESIGNDFYGVPLIQSNNKVNLMPFPSLIELEISEFESLKTWALPSTGEQTIVFPHLVVIKLRNCPKLETMPALDYFQSLKTLVVSNVGIQSLDITKHKPSSMVSRKVNMMLETLQIRKCEKLVSLPSELQFITSVKTMKVSDCPALPSLPNDLFQGFKSLCELSISGCEKLVYLPTSLKTVEVTDSPALTSLPNDLLHGLTFLSELHICRCEALNNIPTSLEECASLRMLTIEGCPSIKGPMPDFSKLKGLRGLYKTGNSLMLMISMLRAVEHLPNLMTLRTGGFSAKDKQELYFSDLSPIQLNQSLHNFYVDGCPYIKSLPHQLKLLTMIKVLIIRNFYDVEELPEWVRRLSSLEELWLGSCTNLKKIPSKEVFLHMRQLRQLYIWECPFLAESCVKDVGSDWDKISHIPSIMMDYVAIQNMA